MARVHVTSEIGPLRAVLVHTPGRELVAVTPGSREDYLYDDIIDLELAQREHRRFVTGLERFAQVYEVRTLLTQLGARADGGGLPATRAREGVPSGAPAQELAPKPRRPRPPVSLGVRALRREGRDRGGDAKRADRNSPGHDLHAARPRAVLHLSAALRGAGAARRAAPPQEIQGREGDAELLRGHAGGRSAARAGVLRGLRPLAAGAGAMVVRL